VLVQQGTFLDVTLFWHLFYGLALVSVAEYVPRLLKYLGLGGLGIGVVLFIFRDWGVAAYGVAPEILAWVVMGVTFGLLHWLYALYIWLNPRA
jgi:hypothetical protein